MKKVFFSMILVLAAVMGMQAATVTSRLRIKLSGDVGTSYGSVMLRVSDEAAYASAFPNTGSSTAYDIDVDKNGTYFAEWQTPAGLMKNVAIAVNPAVGATNCTLTFTLGNSNTETFTLYDAQLDAYFDITPSNLTYNFTVPARTERSWINDRFIINPAETDILPAALGTFVSDKDVAFIEGGHFYEIYDRTDDNAQISFIEVSCPLAAGKPVLYQANAAHTLKVTYDGDAHANLQGEIVGENGEFNGFVGLVPNGTLTVKDIVVPDGEIYVLVSAESRLNQIGSGCTLTAGHAYINMSNITHPVTMPAPGRRMLMIGRSGIVTDVEKIEAVKNGAFKHIENGAVVIFKNGKKFNLAGQELK